MNRIGFIGAGNMTTAICAGIVRGNCEATLSAYDLHADKLEALRSSLGVRPARSVAELAEAVDTLFLAVKPQNFPEVLAELRPVFRPETLLVSIAAGISSSALCESLGRPAKVVQVMPNTPLLLGAGATALCRNVAVCEEEFAFVKKLFDCSGTTAVVPPGKMNEIIPINGSAPAFLYEFAKEYIRYGVSQGLNEELCRRLFAQTMIGSARMLTDSGKTVDELIAMVSSKGGATLEGLDALRRGGLAGAVAESCRRCVKRAYELANEGDRTQPS